MNQNQRHRGNGDKDQGDNQPVTGMANGRNRRINIFGQPRNHIAGAQLQNTWHGRAHHGIESRFSQVDAQPTRCRIDQKEVERAPDGFDD